MNGEVVDFKGLGNKAVSEYFDRLDDNGDKNLLEEIISDIAREECLNNEEICRIVQFANTKIFLRLFKATKEKTVEFDVAKPENIINNLKFEGGSPDVTFDDSYYQIDSKPEPCGDFDGDESFSMSDLVELFHKLSNEKDDLEIKIMESKPSVMRSIKTKMQGFDPNRVLHAIKTAGAPEELIKEANSQINSDDNMQKSYSKALIDPNTQFLNKIASYGRMKKRLEQVEEKLEKIAAIESKMNDFKSSIQNKAVDFATSEGMKQFGQKAKEYGGKAMGVGKIGWGINNKISKIQNAGGRAKTYKSMLNDPNFGRTNKFKVKGKGL